MTDEAKEILRFINQATGGPSANKGKRGKFQRWGSQFTLNYYVDVLMGNLTVSFVLYIPWTDI